MIRIVNGNLLMAVIEFEITSGEVNDCSMVPDLIAKLPDAKAIVAEEKF